MRIGELFRHKLENAEVIPDPSVGVNLMKRVGRQEFLRFDLARFNIYYIGAILVAGLSAGVIFLGGSSESAMNNAPETVTIVNDTLDPGLQPSEDRNLAAVPESVVDNSAAEVKETVQTAEKVAAKVPAAADSATAVSPKTGIRQEAEEKKLEEQKAIDKKKK